MSFHYCNKSTWLLFSSSNRWVLRFSLFTRCKRATETHNAGQKASYIIHKVVTERTQAAEVTVETPAGLSVSEQLALWHSDRFPPFAPSSWTHLKGWGFNCAHILRFNHFFTFTPIVYIKGNSSLFKNWEQHPHYTSCPLKWILTRRL